MKIFRSILLGLLVVIALAAVAGGIFIRHTARKALPDYNRNITLNGLSDEVQVTRDSFAIPHILAKTEYDAYRATGYLMAQDRLWQMDLLRRLTTGRLSEIFGKDLVTADQLFRSLRFTEKSREIILKSDPVIVEGLQAFADGVNQYIAENSDKLPPEFTVLGYKPEPWEPYQSANLIGYMSWGLTMAWQTEVALYRAGTVVDQAHVQELIPDMEMQKSYVHSDSLMPAHSVFISELDHIDQLISDLGLQVFQASNNWAVSGDKSVTGKPLLANDMHLDLNAPGIWYQMHQEVPGKLNVTGVALPGQPYVVCGHNDRIAWGMTNVMLDDMDFYIETLSKDDTSLYRLDGKWLPLKTVKEVIYTKEGDTVVRYNRFTHRGPVISTFKGIKDKVVSMRWIGNEYSNELVSVYKFDRAGNWDEFRDAASSFIAISQNIAYADVDGNIGMQTAAGIPIRKGNHVLFAPGDTSLYDWTGIVPFDELPSTYNPACGYVASANNNTIGKNYPYYISYWFDLPYRYNSIVEGLISREKLGIEDFAAIQSNQTSAYARKLVPVIREILSTRAEELNVLETAGLEKLADWDYTMPVSSVAATIFEQTYLELCRTIFEDELGEELYGKFIEQDLMPTYLIDRLFVTRNSLWCDDVTTKDKTETFGDNVFDAYHNAMVALDQRLGGDVNAWDWGKVHTLTLKHPLGKVSVLDHAFHLNRGPFAVGGSYHTVSPYSYPFDVPFEANHGSSHRHIYSTADWDKSLTVIPTGESGIPASNFYCDQTEMYLSYKYLADPYTTPAVAEQKEFFMKFVPGK
ncbi:MAG: penicillin acylase family protein [Bacteroidales bacterium]|nr:penicillin acylase family protein [Bacteroidales bacterium]